MFENKRLRKVPKFADELSLDERLSDAESYFKTQIFYGTLDIVIRQLEVRYRSLHDIARLFTPIFPQNIRNLSESELEQFALNLVEKYNDDLSVDLAVQIVQLKLSFGNKLVELKTVQDFAKYLIVDNYLLAPNFSEVCTACMLFLTLPVSVAQAERSFSKLKIIKNHLRSSMSQHRLSSLSMISIEKRRAKALNVDDIIESFASAKSRRKI